MKREPFFKCVYSSGRSEYSFHVRAWSAEEAEAHLRTELKTFGVNAAGEIRVLDSQGRILRNSQYKPGAVRVIHHELASAR